MKNTCSEFMLVQAHGCLDQYTDPSQRYVLVCTTVDDVTFHWEESIYHRTDSTQMSG